MRKATKYFNTSGPNTPEKHYTLPRPVLLGKGEVLVANERYFTIWAPRQTGKSTYFRMLAEKLQKEGYKVCHVNFENFANQEESSFLAYLNAELSKGWGCEFNGNSMAALMNQIMANTADKCVLIADEIEGVNKAYFNDFLHTIRNLYHSRETHCLKSVILVGVSNITGIIQDNASPFNIADTLEVAYFTKEEVFELLEMHEKDTDQLFSEEVKEKIYEITAGQPGLVNGFALKLVENYASKELIDYPCFLAVENWYLYEAIDKNVSNIINKAKTYQSYIEELLFTEKSIKFDIDKEEIRFFYVNGLLKKNEAGNVEFWVPLYKKRLQKYFYPHLNGEAKHIQNNIWWEDYMTAEGVLNIDKIIREYQGYAQRRGFRAFFEKDENGKARGLKEAALMYSFETYIQAFLLAVEGKSYLEPHVALGRSDLIVNVRGQEFVIEAKIYYDVVRFLKGKTQLAYYVKSLGLKIGVYLLFASNEVTHRKVQEAVDEIEGVTIYTYLVRYDLKKDFEAKEGEE